MSWTQEEMDEIYEGTYFRWVSGACPCCGVQLSEPYSDTEPLAIGEGVLMCGYCVEHGHHELEYKDPEKGQFTNVEGILTYIAIGAIAARKS